MDDSRTTESADANEERLRLAAEKVGRKLLSKVETNRETTRLLLEGWKMLAETCPISEFPLFQSKRTGEVWSVRLQMPVVTQPTGVEQSAVRASSSVTLPPPSTPGPASSDQISKRIGEKLLLGWEMLNENVSGCPLLKDPNSGRRWLPATAEYVDGEVGDENQLALEEKEDIEDSIITEEPASAPPFAPANTSALDEDEVSRRLSEKLLLGWEMLYEHCPSTQTCPLLRDPRTGQKWSAALNRYIAEDTGVGKVPATIMAVPKQPLAGMDEVDFSVNKVIIAVQGKLNEWTMLLSSASNLDDCRQILSAIREAAETIKMLKDL